MSALTDYANKYQSARLERRDGILLVTFHTEGQSLRWGFLPHGELPELFHDIGADRDNRVVILTGTGAEFSGPRATPGTSSFPSRPSIERIDRIHWEGRHLLMNLLNIEVPVISAINGPAWRHSEIPLLCDVVLAADTAQFQDSAHFMSDVVPGDGMHIVYPLLLGMNRGRYFLMTGQTLDAAEALRLGLVAEVLPPDKLLARTWELAEGLTKKPTLLLRYTRLLFTEYLRRQMHDLLGYGLAMESLALIEKPEAPSAAARALAAELNVAARFVEGNVYDAPSLLEGEAYDIAFVTWGAIIWLPDIRRWAQIVAGLLAPGGWLYLAEGYPSTLSLEEVDSRLVASRSWRTQPVTPFVYDDPTTYTGDSTPLAHPRSYEWCHPLSAIIGGLLESGLRLDFLHEHETLPWRHFPMMVPDGKRLYRLPKDHPTLPLAFSLRASKPG